MARSGSPRGAQARRRGGRLRPRPGAARAGRSSSARSTRAHEAVAEAVEGAELVFCAAPVTALPGLAARGAGRGGRGLRRHRRRLDQAGPDRRPRRRTSRFIGGHPLAGAETAGVENARADLFEGARWYLTPTPTLERDALRPRAARDRRPRRAPAGDRGRDARPADGDGQPPAARGRQRAGRAGGDGAQPRRPSACRRSGRASATRPGSPAPTRRSGATSSPATARPSPPRSTRDRARLSEAAELIRSGDARGGRRLARAAGRATAAGCSRRSSPAARSTSCGSVSPNRPGIVAELALALGRAGVNIEDMALYPAPDMTLRRDLALGRRRRGGGARRAAWSGSSATPSPGRE